VVVVVQMDKGDDDQEEESMTAKSRMSKSLFSLYRWIFVNVCLPRC